MPIPFATVSKLGHFCSRHNAPVHSSVLNEYLAVDCVCGEHVTEFSLCKHSKCSIAEFFSDNSHLCRVNMSARGEMESALSGPTDWILHYIKSYLFT